MKGILFVFLGGGIGSVLRFLVAKIGNSSFTGIPYGTFAANVVGSLLIGFLLGWAAKNQGISENAMLLLATGFCGGFTTFSTFAYENHVFLKAGDFATFGLYTLGSLVIGFMAVFVGIWLVKYF